MISIPHQGKSLHSELKTSTKRENSVFFCFFSVVSVLKMRNLFFSSMTNFYDCILYSLLFAI